MRIRYVIGNLKMNILSQEEMRQYLLLLKRESTGKKFEHVRGIICPPVLYLNLSEFEHLPEGFSKGAQKVFYEKSGAYTGEISPVMLKDAGVEYVLIGHSESRLYGKETDEEIKLKTLSALKNHLVPVVCIGETGEERKKELTEEVLERQVRIVFSGLSKLQTEGIILAYEPRWAIGTEVHPTTTDILQVRVMVRKILTEMFDPQTADRVVMLYGASVKSTHLGSVSWEAGMDGVLVGRESLFPYEIVKMMSMLEEDGQKETLKEHK